MIPLTAYNKDGLITCSAPQNASLSRPSSYGPASMSLWPSIYEHRSNGWPRADWRPSALLARWLAGDLRPFRPLGPPWIEWTPSLGITTSQSWWRWPRKGRPRRDQRRFLHQAPRPRWDLTIAGGELIKDRHPAIPGRASPFRRHSCHRPLVHPRANHRPRPLLSFVRLQREHPARRWDRRLRSPVGSGHPWRGGGGRRRPRGGQGSPPPSAAHTPPPRDFRPNGEGGGRPLFGRA